MEENKDNAFDFVPNPFEQFINNTDIDPEEGTVTDPENDDEIKNPFEEGFELPKDDDDEEESEEQEEKPNGKEPKEKEVKEKKPVGRPKKDEP